VSRPDPTAPSIALPPDPAAAQPIQRRKLADEVTERLLVRIQSAEYPEGSRLPSERDLMALFAVGRPAIRESLQNLERMGLIAIAHGERATVLPVSARNVIGQIGTITRHLLSSSPQTLEHLKQARLFFEVGMVRHAAAHATPDDVAAIRQALAQHRAAADDLPHFIDGDMAFHRAIAAVGGNPIYVALSEAMFGWLAAFHSNVVRATGAEHVTLDEHQRIADCIAHRDSDGAAEAMTAHLTRANTHYALIGQGFAPRPTPAEQER
jgi:GntR family transcriptional regulator, sialic acid-inducible nan operon repressor